jgi:hypothetical protein
LPNVYKAAIGYGLQQELVDVGAVKIKYPLMVIEGKAGVIFKVWANFISKRQKQNALDNSF